MWLVYSDEAGIGDISVEPIAVVAAIAIHPDSQWIGIEKEMKALVSEHVPVEKQPVFEFHAHNLFGQVARPENDALLRGLLAIPVVWKLPIFYAAVHRGAKFQEFNKNKPDVTPQALAFLMCAMKIENLVRAGAPEERLLWIADNTRAADDMRKLHRAFQGQPLILDQPDTRIEHIIDTIYFGDSAHSRGLQLADACNFFIKRHLMKKGNSERFYRLIQPQLNPTPVFFAPNEVGDGA